MLELNLLNAKKEIGRAGYFIEELSNEQFASYVEVTSLAGVTQGTLINEGSGWLRFDYEGTELIVAKVNMRQALSWTHLNSAGCVFGTKVITIKDNQYKVRLLKGADTDPVQLIGNSSNFLEGSHNSEWSRLFYPLITDDWYLTYYQYAGPKDPRYTLSQLQMDSAPYSWCQEVGRSGGSYRVIRGDRSVTSLSGQVNTTNSSDRGWRPCLELVS